MEADINFSLEDYDDIKQVSQTRPTRIKVIPVGRIES
jgi:hypothetical protein